MTKLKTLEDFYKDIEGFKNISLDKKQERYLTLKMLRKEAILWALDGKIRLDKLKDKEKKIEMWGGLKFIMYFFNLTEEGLK